MRKWGDKIPIHFGSRNIKANNKSIDKDTHSVSITFSTKSSSKYDGVKIKDNIKPSRYQYKHIPPKDNQNKTIQNQSNEYVPYSPSQKRIEYIPYGSQAQIQNYFSTKIPSNNPSNSMNHKDTIRMTLTMLDRSKDQFFNISKEANTTQLKKFICQNISKNYLFQQFVLYHEDIRLKSKEKLSTNYKYKRCLTLKQKLKKIQDLPFCVPEIVQHMKKKYDNNRRLFKKFIQKQLENGSTCFKESFQINGKSGMLNWSFQDIRLAGGYSQTEMKTIIEKVDTNFKYVVIIRTLNNIQLQYKIKPSSGGCFYLTNPVTAETIISFIYQKSKYTELKPEQTILTYQGNWIKRGTKIQNIIKQHKILGKVVLIQKKATILQLQNQHIDHLQQDPISCEVGVVRMPCGHFIGTSLSQYVKSQFQRGEVDVKCPMQISKNNKCNRIWKESIWRLVGMFTKTQMNQLDYLKSVNWIKKNSKNCPFCSQSVFFPDLESKRVSCPHCQTCDFCFDCLEHWKSSTAFCSNDKCQSERQILATCPITREFYLRQKCNQKKQGNQIFTIFKTPTHRACPHCQQLIQNYVGCKHTTCSCGQDFCFVCLSKMISNEYPCGEYDDYCGKVAPRQK